MSSLPSKSGDKTLEEFIKHELLSTFLLNPKLKDILEDEDTQDESIKELNSLRYSLEKEMKIELSVKDNYIIKYGTLEYLTKNGFHIEDAPLEPIITLKKKIGEEYLVELSARPFERDEQKTDKNKEYYVTELEKLAEEKFQIKTTTPLIPIEEKKIYSDFVNSLISRDNPYGVKKSSLFIFNIIITDLIQNQGIKFFCNFQENEIIIGQVELLLDINNKDYEKKSIFAPIDRYLCQEFMNLSDVLQKQFIEYIKSFGITPHICCHLEYLSYFKEEINYLNWMREINHYCIKLFEAKMQDKII